MEKRDPSVHSTQAAAQDVSDKPEVTLVEDIEAAGYAQVYKRHGRVVSLLLLSSINVL